jgi:Mitochondrial carrier protein
MSCESPVALAHIALSAHTGMHLHTLTFHYCAAFARFELLCHTVLKTKPNVPLTLLTHSREQRPDHCAMSSAMIVVAPLPAPSGLFTNTTFPMRSPRRSDPRYNLLFDARPFPSFRPTAERDVESVDWGRIARVTSIAVFATVASQLFGTPIDCAARLAKQSGSTSPVPFPVALIRVARTGTLMNGLPIHLLRRAPTKALSAVLSEIAVQKLHLNTDHDGKRLALAASCASAALFCTFPLHWYTHAVRKGLSNCVRSRATHMYAGVLPALASVAPVVIADHCIFRSVRSMFQHGQCAVDRSFRTVRHPSLRPTINERCWEVSSIIVAAGLSATVAGALVQPLKEVSRRVAVQSVISPKSPSAVSVFKEMLAAGGPAELYRGYKTRAIRYGICGAVAKLASRQLREAL